MLLVPTYVSESPIAGKGLFAARDIEPGEIIWRFVEGFDRKLSPDDFESLTLSERAAVLTWGYLDRHLGHWILCGDEALRVNHSDRPNLAGGYDASDGRADGYSYALRRIAVGEELTDDYRSYDLTAARKLNEEPTSGDLWAVSDAAQTGSPESGWGDQLASAYEGLLGGPKHAKPGIQR